MEDCKKVITRARLVKELNKSFEGVAKGIMTDDYWLGVRAIEKAITKVCDKYDLSWFLIDAKYESEDGVNVRKRYTYAVERYLEDKDSVIVVCIGSGAGPVNDPLAAYDIIAYAS